MKSLRLIPVLFLFLGARAQEPLYNVVFFVNSPVTGDYFFSSSGDSGNSWVFSNGQKLPASTEFFHTPGNALKLEYIDGKTGR
ncbi:MAG: hypothetical protein EOO05_18945, partial [Chitinophagaceae bacterium]